MTRSNRYSYRFLCIRTQLGYEGASGIVEICKQFRCDDVDATIAVYHLHLMIYSHNLVDTALTKEFICFACHCIYKVAQETFANYSFTHEVNGSHIGGLTE